MDFQKLLDSCAQNKTSEISKNALSECLGLLLAEQHVGNLKQCTSRNSGTPVRRTKRQKSQKTHVQELWDSCAQNKTSEIPKNARLGILGLLYAEQNIGNLKNYTFKNSGTPVRRTIRRKSHTTPFPKPDIRTQFLMFSPKLWFSFFCSPAMPSADMPHGTRG